MTTEGASREEIRRGLERARQELLDLTARNRLLNTPRFRARSSSIEIVGEDSDQLYTAFVDRGHTFTFLPRAEPVVEPEVAAGELEQPEDDGSTVAERQSDRRLQTDLESRALQTRLLRTYYAARTFEEEQGVNLLHLALGFLEWREQDDPDTVRFAPLILVPVVLDRRSAASRFQLRYSGDDLTTNLSLQARLAQDYGLELPELEEDEELSAAGYFDRVEQAVAGLDGWRVHRNDAVLWFFSFTRLLMYRDLEPDNWPAAEPLEAHPLISTLLGHGFDGSDVLPEDARIDEILAPEDAVHVLDADSSQALAIESVRRGQNLVIQGPPGTGKSQTIANLIATAVRDGQRVLFVAEKVAALDVVKRRLENIGLGDLCLALHSRKANKRLVLEELARTLELSRPVLGETQEQAERLKVVRDRLNEQVAEMHRPGRPTGCSPFELVRDLVELRAEGVRTPDFELPEAALWTPEAFDDKQSALRELIAYVREVGPPGEHPWRGVMLDSVLPTDVDRLGEQIPALRDELDCLREAGRQLTARLPGLTAPTAQAVRQLGGLARHRAAAPEFDRAAYSDPAWVSAGDQLVGLVDAVRQVAAARAELDEVVIGSAWRDDVDSIRRDLHAHDRSWLRFLNGTYRRAFSRFRGLLVGEPPRSRPERIALLDRLRDGQRAVAALEANDDLGRRLFGTLWKQESSDVAALERLVAWDRDLASLDGDPAELRGQIAAIEETEGLSELADNARRAAHDAPAHLDEAFDRLSLNRAAAFDGRAETDQVPLAVLAERLELWQRHLESISQWIAIRIRTSRAREEGLGAVVDRLDEGRLDPDDALGQFLVATRECMLREMMQERLELSDFDGLSFQRLRDEFCALDEERLVMTRREVAHAHYEQIPRGGAGIGEMGILRHEIGKKRRHLPLRQLLRRAGSAITSIKPVFMMSPLSIAQYVAPGALEFDLLVIDEASQVRPVDALGAIARCKRIVVVGDERQLPPTAFFRRVVDDDDDAIDADQLDAGDLESILGLCTAQNTPSRMLRWHYRSRHHSLIAVSNREFYDGRLFVIPSPSLGEPGLGLDFVHVSEGIFDRGGTGVNRAEAEAVADAVMEHARTHPDVSLGVGAFSVRQRDAILDALERQRRRHRKLESFFATDLPEPFFVKNLENIQGDERDVILISVGYGRDTSGRLRLHFGPLSTEGGERRLNVLITRARRRCSVYASIMPEDIDLRRATGAGPRALRTFLTFARDGVLDGDGEPAVATSKGDGFEEVVAEVLREAGYTVHARIGISGIRVDLGVVDPDVPSRYILGLECDGASYLGAPSARDRDRLRETVLTDRGWRLHRLWIRDWFQRPDDQRRILLEVVRAAAANARATRQEQAGPDMAEVEEPDPFIDEEFDAEPVEAIERELRPVADDQITDVAPYREASFAVPRDVDPGDLPPEKLAKIVARIIKIESPIHRDEIAQRVRLLFGLSRTGARINRIVSGAVDAVIAGGTAEFRNGFVSLTGARIVVRNRAAVESSTLRNLAMLPPGEVEACLEQLIEAHLGVSRDQLATAAARQLGFRSTSRHLRNHLLRRLDGLIERSVIVEEDGRLHAAGSG